MSDSCCSQDSNCCDSIPDHHMCKMTQPVGRFDLAKVIELADNPKYICRCCGRSANEADNLCTPVPLK